MTFCAGKLCQHLLQVAIKPLLTQEEGCEGSVTVISLTSNELGMQYIPTVQYCTLNAFQVVVAELGRHNEVKTPEEFKTSSSYIAGSRNPKLSHDITNGS